MWIQWSFNNCAENEKVWESLNVGSRNKILHPDNYHNYSGFSKPTGHRLALWQNLIVHSIDYIETIVFHNNNGLHNNHKSMNFPKKHRTIHWTIHKYLMIQNRLLILGGFW